MHAIDPSTELNPAVLEGVIKANHEDVAFPLGKVAILRMRGDVGRILDGLLKIGEEGLHGGMKTWRRFRTN